MREIKFRAWDGHNKRMIGWYDVTFINLDKDGRNNTTRQLCEYSMKHVGSESNFFRYMQYTGLKDKNGKEIYEGDIVNRYWHEAYAPDVWEVKWDAPNACFFLFNKNGKDWLDEDPLEIIGNIYENPELLDDALNDKD